MWMEVLKVHNDKLVARSVIFNEYNVESQVYTYIKSIQNQTTLDDPVAQIKFTFS